MSEKKCPKCGTEYENGVCPNCGLVEHSDEWIDLVNLLFDEAAEADASGEVEGF